MNEDDTRPAEESPQAPPGLVDEDADGDGDGATVAETSIVPPSHHGRAATAAALMLVLTVGGLVGWLSWSADQSHRAEVRRDVYVQVGKQGALNLTTIDYQRVDDDMRRILDSATGTFYDDFEKRATPFVEVVKQVKSKSVGTITEAGLESEAADGAQVLVAVSVNTSEEGQPEQQPRAWRMRISLHDVDGGKGVKVSNVEFVP